VKNREQSLTPSGVSIFNTRGCIWKTIKCG
jgi:hypothetical protein